MTVCERVWWRLMLALPWGETILASVGYCAAPSVDQIKVEVLYQPNP